MYPRKNTKVMSNEKETAVQILVDSLIKLGYLHSYGFGQSLKVTEVIKQAKEMEEKQKGYTLEQMMDCWNAALKFEPHGSNSSFIVLNWFLIFFHFFIYFNIINFN